MRWTQERDDDDREFWTAASAFHDEGAPLLYRVTRFGRSRWTIRSSDDELLSLADRRRRFVSLEDAKSFVEQREREAVEVEKRQPAR